MKIHLGKKPPQGEELEALKRMAIANGEEFVEWVLPFYNPFLTAALRSGRWKANVGVSHIWLEGYAGLRVMLGGSTYSGERWLHLAASRKDRLPGWLEFSKLKDTFLGADRAAYQVIPPTEHYVNDNPYVLHLWSSLGKPMYLPDFRIEIPGSGGKLSI